MENATKVYHLPLFEIFTGQLRIFYNYDARVTLFLNILFLVIPAPQCVVDNDCRTTEQCHSGNCLNACYVDKCGVNAICSARQHESTCTCPPNYTGDPKKACYPSKFVKNALDTSNMKI